MLNYPQPIISSKLFWQETPIEIATDKNIAPFGVLVDDYQEYKEKPDSSGSVFNFWWKGNSIYSEDESKNDRTLLGWSVVPEETEGADLNRAQALLWNACQYPDAGQLYYPLRGEDYIIVLAESHSDIKPNHFRSFHITGGKGIYIHPGIWQEGIIPLNERASFYIQRDTENQKCINFTEDMGSFLVIPLKTVRS
ncbi:ureidoglycolate lyase [Fulvivirga sp. 29W222]|uniref:Ureidoglycolate lyase n=1 Tax=Fulvivirga marina TaxID=2494733 RepID=A0A937KDJ9_9BACT|nr:ureidoglycolate lyase [Fulvivirga marina]MBL6448697.1 ureidoglycolate lyase [Fulvivirga marina]